MHIVSMCSTDHFLPCVSNSFFILIKRYEHTFTYEISGVGFVFYKIASFGAFDQTHPKTKLFWYFLATTGMGLATCKYRSFPKTHCSRTIYTIHLTILLEGEVFSSSLHPSPRKLKSQGIRLSLAI